MNEETKRKIKQQLYEQITAWSESVAETETLDIVWGGQTTALMTDAAFAVLNAVAESQEYALDQGFVKAA